MEQRINLKFLVKLRKTPNECFKLFKKFYGKDMMSRTQILESHKRFEKGSEALENDLKTGRLSKIVRTDFLFRLSSCDIIRTVNLQSLYTSYFTLVVFSSAFVVKGGTILRSFFTALPPFSKRLCHSKICVLDISLYHKRL